MQESGAQELLIAKNAEIAMLRQQLAQLSSDLSRNLEVLAARDAEHEGERQSVSVLTALLAEKDELFNQYQGQVAQLEALRQREAAECKTLQAALESQKREWQQQLNDEQQQRAEAEQQLKRAEESSAAQLLSARQAAVDAAVQHSSQHQAELEHVVGQHKQLQQQVQVLQGALATKESELSATQLQLAAALESSKRVQDSHGKAMAAKSDAMAQVQQEVDQAKAGMARASKAHEAHIAQLINSLNDMQQLCSKQAGEVQQYAESHKALQQELKVMQKSLDKQQQACHKAEVRRSAMEGALQNEVAGHAAARAQNDVLQHALVALLTDLQHQHAVAEATEMQLSALLSQTQEQLVSAAAADCVQASESQASPTHELKLQCQAVQADLLVAQTQSACWWQACQQVQRQVLPLLGNAVGSPNKCMASTAQTFVQPSPPRLAEASATPASPVSGYHSCMAALAHSMQQQQQVASDIQQHNVSRGPGALPGAPVAAASSAATQEPALVCVTFEGSGQPNFAACGCKQQSSWAAPKQPAQTLHMHQSSPSQQQCCCVPSHGSAHQAAGATTSAAPLAPLSGFVGQLQAGVARLQQQLSNSQQLMKQTRPLGPCAAFNATRASANIVHHSTCCVRADMTPGQAECVEVSGGQLNQRQRQPLHQQQQQQWATNSSSSGPAAAAAAALGHQQQQQHQRHWSHQHAHHLVGAPVKLRKQQGVPASHDAIPPARLLGQHSGTVVPMGCLWPQAEVDGTDEDAASTCNKRDSNASDSSRHSDLSCGPEVAAAVAAARGRMQQHVDVPAVRSRSTSRRPSVIVHQGKSCTGTAGLAALASATLKKLERLSAESAQM